MIACFAFYGTILGDVSYLAAYYDRPFFYSKCCFDDLFWTSGRKTLVDWPQKTLFHTILFALKDWPQADSYYNN